MIKFKTKNLEDQFYSTDMCPYVFWKICQIARFAEKAYTDIVITSVYRNDNSSHSDIPYRAVDIRVVDPKTGERTVKSHLFEFFKSFHDTLLKHYGRYDSFIEHDVGRGRHIHCQRPKELEI